MANKQTIELVIEGNNVTAIKAIDGVETKLKGMGGAAKTAQGPLDKLSSSLGIGLGALSFGAAVTGLGLLIKNSIDTADRMDELSEMTGMTVESMSTLSYVAKLSGSDVETLGTAFRKFSVSIDGAANGVSSAVDTFKRLGVSVKDNNGVLKNNEQILLEVANKFKGMEDEATKAAISQELFSRGGSTMILMLNKGKEGIQKLQEEARKLGLEISTNTAKQAGEFNDNLDRLKGAVSGVGLAIASELLPSLTAISSSMVAVTTDGQSTMTVAQGLGLALKILTTVGGGVATSFLVFAEALGTFWAVAAKIITFQWDEIGDTVSTGFEKIKSTALSAGQGFDALWQDANKYKELMDNLNKGQREQDALAEQNKKIIQLREQWKSVSETLERDIILAGLDPQSVKLQQLIWKAQDLKIKYQGIANANELINMHLQSQIEKTFALDNVTIKAAIKPELPKKDQFEFIDLTQFKTAEDIAKKTFQNISAEAMLHYALMNDHSQMAFGNMAEAMIGFYEAGGQRSQAFFAMYKAFAVAETIISTYKAAANALEAPPVGLGPVWGWALAATVIASGLARVAQIASTQPGSRGGSGGGSYSGSLPRSSGMQDYTRSVTNNNNSTTYTPTITININGKTFLAKDFPELIRDLSPEIQKAIRDGLINTKMN